ncbi:MAG: glycosyltransferase family 9 protein [Candidatus Hodarchaeota archaeon]
MTSWDRIFDRHRPMVENIATAIASVLQCKHISKNNGIVPPKELVHRKNCNRIVIHPAATSPNRWDLQKFVNIATRLQKDGFEVVFCVSSIERKEWFSLLGDSFVLPHFPTLAELASFIFESGYLIGNDSGPGHMASNLQLPTLTIANSAKRMALWRPGWLEGKVVAPLPFIPNFKGLRLREKKWKAFISTKRVLNHFYQLIT